MKHRLILLSCLFALSIPGYPVRAEPPRNIVLMIGDGMGVGQVTAGYTTKGWLALEEFKVLGLVLTQAYGDEYITDSAAAATAMATGVTTYNGAIGVDKEETPRETVLERAQKLGIKTGLVVTCSITHATPASFVAHVPSRNMELEIAEQMSRASTDLYLGAGWQWFLPESKGGVRTDGVNLIDTMKRRGYSYLSTPDEFNALDVAGSKRIIGLFARQDLDWADKREPSLSAMTSTALRFLSASGDGFFLMVEGSQIDWAGHDRDSRRVAAEMNDFDDAIAAVLDFVKDHPETLVIVTADHETGGYALKDGSTSDKRIEGGFATDEHTGVMIPLFAMGPGAERFAGIQHNSDIGKNLLELLR